MIFLGEPMLYVKINNPIVKRVTGLKGFTFDENGEYKTEVDLMIRVLKQNFEVKKEVKEKIKKELPKYENKQVEPDRFQCKECDFETENKGELMAHYKKEHKKVK